MHIFVIHVLSEKVKRNVLFSRFSDGLHYNWRSNAMKRVLRFVGAANSVGE